MAKHPLASFKELGTWFNRDKIILNHVKKRNEILAGGQSIKRQTGFMGRNTFDYDILSPRARSSARVLEKTLDKKSGGDNYFTMPSKFHKGTFKVIHKGRDMIKNTRDDIPLVDISVPDRRIQTVRINGIKHSTLKQEVANKRRALADPTQEFRFKKDAEDIQRIKAAKRMRRK